jgi:hypothetical protein
VIVNIAKLIAVTFTLLGLMGASLADPTGQDRQSAYALMSAQTQAMQYDPAQTPATFWLLDGQTIWQTPA